MSPEVKGYQRFDSRGRPTVQATIEVGGIPVSALVPSGASTGINEAMELRDGGKPYLGYGVSQAIRNINKLIAPAIKDLHVFEQQAIDTAMIELDGTENKSRLGANAILAVSLAVARAAAKERGVPLYHHLAELHGNPQPHILPVPMFNVINGGVHARNGLDFQEFMIVPQRVGSFAEAMQRASEVYQMLSKIVPGGVGDEGGLVPVEFSSNKGRERVKEVLDLLINAIQTAGYNPGSDIAIALDPAASEFYREGFYHLEGFDLLSPDQMVNFCQELVGNYPIISVEDFVAQDDDEGWEILTNKLGSRLQLVGDDRFVTNPTIFKEAIENRIGNAILVKPNQIGTLTETLEVIKMAQDADYKTIISHRSGDTEDTYIADLAVATNAGQIKTGAPARGERTAKYNRLLDIEEIDLPAAGVTPAFGQRTEG